MITIREMARQEEIMTNGQTTTYPKAKLAEIKRRGGFSIAVDVMTDIKMNDPQYEAMPLTATRVAVSQIASMTTRQLYQFLKDNGYTFNATRAIWQAAEIEATS